MGKPSSGRFLDRLLQLDEARNARPRSVQQPSEMAKERDARLAGQVEKIAALRRARETSGALHPDSSPGQVTVGDNGDQSRRNTARKAPSKSVARKGVAREPAAKSRTRRR
jgi:hypothetical protein